jgi:hypothetical protein
MINRLIKNEVIDMAERMEKIESVLLHQNALLMTIG